MLQWLGVVFLALTVAACSDSTMNRLKGQIVSIEKQLESLPVPLSGPAGGTLGYASSVVTESELNDPSYDRTRWVGLDLGRVREVDAIFVIPAVMAQRNFLEVNHGFPPPLGVSDSGESRLFRCPNHLKFKGFSIGAAGAKPSACVR